MAENNLQGVNYLRKKLALKSFRVKKRYAYYEMKNAVEDLHISTPDALQSIQYCLGWCAKAVDSLADRLTFRGFGNDVMGFEQIFALNNSDVFFDSAILSALISSCCFVYIAPDLDGFPRLRVVDGGNATGIIDPITNLLKEGYAVLDRDEMGQPITEAYLTPESTTIIRGRNVQTFPNPSLYPLLVPIIFRPDAVRPFGHSRISRACMSIVQSALRTVKRSEITAEFYSFPQRYAVGTDPDMKLDTWRSAISYFLTISKDDDDDAPTLGQFAQQSVEPHVNQLKMFAAMFAGETGLTLDDLGFVTDNPSSAEAIKAAHENLRLTARKAQRTFGSGFLNVGYLAACVRDNYPYLRHQVHTIEPRWAPIFEPDASMLSGIGDGALKINQAVPGYIDDQAMENLTGITAGG